MTEEERTQEEGPPCAADHHHRHRDDHRDRLGVRALGQAPAARDRDLEHDQRAADPGRRHPVGAQHLHRHHDLRQRRRRGRARQPPSPAARAACRPDLRSASKRRRRRRRKGALRAQGPAAVRRRERGRAEQADRAVRRRGRVRGDHRRGGDPRPDLGGRVGDRRARAARRGLQAAGGGELDRDHEVRRARRRPDRPQPAAEDRLRAHRAGPVALRARDRDRRRPPAPDPARGRDLVHLRRHRRPLCPRCGRQPRRQLAERGRLLRCGGRLGL